MRKQNSFASLLGARIKKERENRGISQAELAKLSHTSPGALSLIEQGKRIPGADIVVRLAGSLGVTSDYLLGMKKLKDLDDYLKDPLVAAILREMEGLSKKKRALALKIIKTITSEK
ncbi:MAG: helix-turn-helix transcriptional regulator [Thermodesulfobacteriota bacterium]